MGVVLELGPRRRSGHGWRRSGDGPAASGARLGDGDDRRRGEQAADPVARPERAQHDRADGERDEARADEEEGDHAGDATRADMERPEGTSTTRGR